MAAFTRNDAVNLVANVTRFVEAVGEFIREHGSLPAAASQASMEFTSYPTPEMVKTAYGQGSMMVEVAADHLSAFATLATEPVHTIAPWTSVRSVLESSALAAWFLDPKVDVNTRVSRGFAFRYEGIEQQVKFIRAVGMPQSDIDKTKARIDAVEAQALGLGFSQILDGKGNRIGIGEKMPSITDLIAITLNKESDYRLLSAMHHCHTWALSQLGFQVISDDKLGSMLEKQLSPMSIAFLTRVAVTSFTVPLWYSHQYYGLRSDLLGKLLDGYYDDLNLGTDVRFWRTS